MYLTWVLEEDLSLPSGERWIFLGKGVAGNRQVINERQKSHEVGLALRAGPRMVRLSIWTLCATLKGPRQPCAGSKVKQVSLGGSRSWLHCMDLVSSSGEARLRTFSFLVNPTNHERLP